MEEDKDKDQIQDGNRGTPTPPPPPPPPPPWFRDKEEIPDFFEPQYIIEALLLRNTDGRPLVWTKEFSLGHLIFGAETWRQLLAHHGMQPQPLQDDPITLLYKSSGVLLRVTNLRP